jgi:hypothetical protein
VNSVAIVNKQGGLDHLTRVEPIAEMSLAAGTKGITNSDTPSSTLDPARRRELLKMTNAGQAVLAKEDDAK